MKRIAVFFTLSIFLLFILLFLAPTPVAQAYGCVVMDPGDSGTGTLRDALANPDGNPILFAYPMTITLASQLTINRNVTINAAGQNITISGNHLVRFFSIASGFTVELDNLTIANGNGSGSGGGGIFNNGTLIISGSTLEANYSPWAGGAIYNATGATLTLTNDTLVNNAGSGEGGAIANYGSLIATNITLSANSGSTGGGMSNAHSNPIVRNSILWGNTASYAAQINNTNSNPSITYSDVQGGYLGVGNINADPLFAPLGNYGGSTKTLALLPGSAAIDAGDNASCTASDQRGIARRQNGACDIGAFESQGFSFGSLTGTPQSATINTAFATPLSLTVSSSHGEPVNAGKVAFTPPASGPSATITGSPATITAFATPLSLTVSSSHGEPVNGGKVAFTPPASGPSATITGSPATITGGNTVGGPYNVTASAAGATSVSFSLTNNCVSTITVMNNSDSGAGSLRQAISNVCAGGTITFNSNYTITLASQLQIAKNLTIDGAGHPITVSGNNTTRVFNIASGNIILNALNIINGGGGDSGGGIWNEGTLTVTNSTLAGNSGYGGGAIRNSGGTLTIVNSTLANNAATMEGGGIANYGTLAIVNSTFANNRVNNSIGGGINNASTAMLKNTIVANSPSGGNCGGTPFAAGSVNNFDNDGTCGGFTQSASISLGTLGNHGGDTLTIPLQLASVAIDAGNAANCPVADQRGKVRNDLRCDVGAYEYTIDDGNQVQKSNLAQGTTFTFGPALGKITRNSTDDPGAVTFIKIPAWVSQPSNAIKKLWDLNATGATYNLTLSLCFTEAERNGLTPSQLKLWRYTGSGWENKGGTLDTSNPNITCVWASGITALSRWTLATGDPGGAPTGVTVIRFIAKPDTDGITLEWQTLAELNVISYQVERSLDGTTYLPLGASVPAIGGSYTVRDNSLQRGQAAFYRLIAIGPNGSRTTYGPITSARTNATNYLFLPLVRR